MTNAIQHAINEVLVAEGFRGSGNTWRSELDNCVVVVNLQKSAWSRAYYINMGIWFNALGRKKAPKENECHIRRRLGGEKLETALELEDRSTTEDERKSVIARAIRQRCLPLLKRWTVKSDLKRMLRDGKLDNDLVDIKVWRLLGVKLPS